MKTTNGKTTIYLDPKIKKSVQYYAIRFDSSLSKIINDKLFEYLEDMADITALEAANKDGEDFISLEQVVNDLGLDLNDIQREAQTEHKKAA